MLGSGAPAATPPPAAAPAVTPPPPPAAAPAATPHPAAAPAATPHPAAKLRHLLAYAAAIFVLWLPALIVFSPGSVAADGYWQIDYYFLGEVSPYDIHPPFSTNLLGSLYFAGESLGGSFGGVLLASGAQVASAVAAFSCACLLVERLGMGFKAGFATALFFGLVPMFANVGFTVFKDSWYLSLFVLFVAVLICAFNRFAAGGLGAGTRWLALAVLLALALCLFRKEAVVIGAVSLAGLGLAFARLAWRRFLLALLAFALGLGALGLLGQTTSTLNSRGVSLEMASIPLQQTARLLRDAPESVSLGEQEVIDQVLVYNSGVAIAERYDPELSDNVKGFNIYIETDVMLSYAGVYLAQGLRHPEIYLDAFLHQTYGYYSPVFDSTTYYAEQSAGFGGEGGAYVLSPSHLTDAAVRQGFVEMYVAAWQALPLRLFWTAGSYAWVCAFLVALLAHKRRRRELAVFLPVALVMAFCILSPVNGNMRYFMPVIASAPMLLAFVRQRLIVGQ